MTGVVGQATAQEQNCTAQMKLQLKETPIAKTCEFR